MNKPFQSARTRSSTTKERDATDESYPTLCPDPEVRPKAKRRTFPTKYKIAIVEEADACTRVGEVEAMLRREGLYSSHLSKWRRQFRAGELTEKRKPMAHQASRDQLELENVRLRKQLEQAQTVIEVQKKLCDLLGPLSVSSSKSD